MCTTTTTTPTTTSSGGLPTGEQRQAILDEADTILSRIDRDKAFREMKYGREVDAKNDPAVKIARMKGDTSILGEMEFAEGTRQHRIQQLLEETARTGDGKELEKTVSEMNSHEKLLFFVQLHEFRKQPKKVVVAESDAINDMEWAVIMDAALIKFSELGKRLQLVDQANEAARLKRLQKRSLSGQENDGNMNIASQATSSDVTVSPSSELYVDAKLSIRDVCNEHIGRFIKIDDEVISRLMPEGFAGRLAQEWVSHKSKYIMLRSAVLRIVQRLRDISIQKQTSSSSSSPAVSLHIGGGTGGAGRSTVLAFGVLWARHHPDWLVVYVPKASSISCSGEQIVPSKRLPNLYMQPRLGQAMLTNLMNVHEAQLKRILLKRDYTASGTSSSSFVVDEQSSSPATLYDLALFGSVEENDEGGEIMIDFFAELELATEVNVLVAVDNVNEWHVLPSAYYDMAYENKLVYLAASRLALVDRLERFRCRQHMHGVGMFSVSAQYAVREGSNALRREGLTELTTVLPYSHDEFNVVMKHAVCVKHVLNPDADKKHFTDFVRSMSGRVPSEVSRVIKVL